MPLRSLPLSGLCVNAFSLRSLLPPRPGDNCGVGGLIDVIIFRRRGEPKLEPGVGASPHPKLWFCPSPGTPDWRALADPATFAMLAADCDALQLYQDQLLDAPMPAPGLPRAALPPHGWNTWRAFREWGILSLAASHSLPVIVESPGLKEWSDDPAVYVDRILESTRRARSIGGEIHAISFDEPWNAGLNLRQPSWTCEAGARASRAGATTGARQRAGSRNRADRAVPGDDGRQAVFERAGIRARVLSSRHRLPSSEAGSIARGDSERPRPSCRLLSTRWMYRSESSSGVTKKTRPRPSCKVHEHCLRPSSRR